MAQIVRQIYGVGRSASITEVTNQVELNKFIALVEQLNINTSNDIPDELYNSNNNVGLSDGTHPGLILQKADGRIGGISKGSLMRGSSIIHEDVMFDNITFISGETFKGAMVDIRAKATAIFNNCTFIKQKEDKPSEHVTMAASARGIFIGCKFIGEFDAVGTNVIIEATGVPPADLNFIGCFNKTGAAVIGPAPSFCVSATSLGSILI